MAYITNLKHVLKNRKNIDTDFCPLHFFGRGIPVRTDPLTHVCFVKVKHQDESMKGQMESHQQMDGYIYIYTIYVYVYIYTHYADTCIAIHMCIYIHIQIHIQGESEREIHALI